MVDTLALTSLPVGSSFSIQARITAADATTVALEFLQPDGAVHGTLDITVATGAIAGSLDVELAETQVTPVAIALAIGDVVRNTDSGETMIVQATGLGPHGDKWSPSAAERPTYKGEGWSVIDHIDLDP